MFVWLLRVYKPTMDGILLLAFGGLNQDQKLCSPLAHTQPPQHAVLPPGWLGSFPGLKDHGHGTGSLFPSGSPKHTAWVSRHTMLRHKPQDTLLRARAGSGGPSSTGLSANGKSLIKPPWNNLNIFRARQCLSTFTSGLMQLCPLSCSWTSKEQVICPPAQASPDLWSQLEQKHIKPTCLN